MCRHFDSLRGNNLLISIEKEIEKKNAEREIGIEKKRTIRNE